MVGISGSGKSWIASRLAAELDLPYLELDLLRHQPGWEELPDEQFLAQVQQFVTKESWVVDGNYFAVVTEKAVWPLADTVIWVDPPKWTVMRQVIWRTTRRVLLRKKLWNGNREQLRDVLRWDPYRSIIRWSWTNYEVDRVRYEAAMGDSRWQHLEFVRLRSKGEVRRYVDHRSRGFGRRHGPRPPG